MVVWSQHSQIRNAVKPLYPVGQQRFDGVIIVGSCVERIPKISTKTYGMVMAYRWPEAMRETLAI